MEGHATESCLWFLGGIGGISLDKNSTIQLLEILTCPTVKRSIEKGSKIIWALVAAITLEALKAKSKDEIAMLDTLGVYEKSLREEEVYWEDAGLDKSYKNHIQNLMTGFAKHEGWDIKEFGPFLFEQVKNFVLIKNKKVANFFFLQSRNVKG